MTETELYSNSPKTNGGSSSTARGTDPTPDDSQKDSENKNLRAGKYRPTEIISKLYEIQTLLGSGGMGEVYKVKDITTGRILALKLLTRKLNPDLKDKNGNPIESEETKRFKQEMELTKKLNSPLIVRAYDYGETDGQPYFTMEYVDSITLRDALGGEISHPLPMPEVVGILIQIASGLHHAHLSRVIHRDLKPENILLDPNGLVKITDFGIGRVIDQTRGLTNTNQVVGTIFYMSPEQLRKDPIGPGSDIYAFGILAFELATGQRPFYDPDNPAAIVVKHFQEPIPLMAELNPEIPDWFQKFVERCCEKEVDDRYNSMSEIVQILLPHIDDDSPEGLENEAHQSPQFIKSEAIRRYSNAVILEGMHEQKRVGQIEHSFRAARRYWRKFKSWQIRAVASLCVAFMYLLLQYPIIGVPLSGKFGTSANYKMMEAWFALRGPTVPPANVTVVTIDDESYAQIGADPDGIFPRGKLAEFLELIAPYNPKAIFLDFSFRTETDAATDARLANALKLNPTYIGKGLKQITRRGIDNSLTTEDQWILPREPFLSSATGLFLVNFPVDDGAVRQFKFSPDTPDGKPPLAEFLKFNSLPHPGDYIDYYGPAGSLPTVPIQRLLKNDPSEISQAIKGRFIFVGQSRAIKIAGQQSDVFNTPFNSSTAGVEIHATVAENLSEGRWLKQIDPQVELPISFILAGLFSFIMLTVSQGRGLVILCGLTLSWAVVSYLAFTSGWIVPSALFMLGVLPAIYVTALLRSHFLHKRLKASIGIS